MHDPLVEYQYLFDQIGIADKSMVELVHFPKKQILFSPGDACQLFLILVVGRVRVELTTKNGRQLVLYQIENGENCLLTTSALLNDERYYTQAVTESDVTALAIPAEKFHQAMASQTGFSNYVLEGFSSRMSAIIGLLDRIATRDVSASIARFLLENQQDNACIFVTQKSLAMQIGSAREVVSRKLAGMQKKGIIERENTCIQIVNQAELERIAGC